MYDVEVINAIVNLETLRNNKQIKSYQIHANSNDEDDKPCMVVIYGLPNRLRVCKAFSAHAKTIMDALVIALAKWSRTNR